MQNLEDLSKENLIDLIYSLREALILDDPEADEDEISDGVWDAKQLLGHFNPRPPEVNHLDEFLKDLLGEDAHLFTSDGKNREDKTDKASLMEYVKHFEDHMRCNCDLDNWEPDQSTGHSHVCRIHAAANDAHRYNHPLPIVLPKYTEPPT